MKTLTRQDIGEDKLQTSFDPRAQWQRRRASGSHAVSKPSSIVILAGSNARERIRHEGLQAAQVGVVPAAAGGPKGLALHGLDCFVFGEWLPQAPRPRSLIGASIGAWRMAAAAHTNPAAAFKRLARAYAGQRYTAKPTPAEVSRVCRGVIEQLLANGPTEPLSHPQHRLCVVTTRGRGVLERPRSVGSELLGFSLATLANLSGRKRLAGFMERVIFHDRRDGLPWMKAPFDAFGSRLAALAEATLTDALLASGSIPLLLEPVKDIGGAPPGAYWDGGVIDYHLNLPYSRQPELVLYPHFTDHIVPGWLDKALTWRRARGEWLRNVLMVAPSPSWVASLPRGKLPDRSDFKHYGLDHAARERDWLFSVGESERLGDDFADWLAKPDPDRVVALDRSANGHAC